MKILLHDYLYSGLTKEFYSNHNVKNLSYDEIKEKLTEYSYQWLPYFYLEGKEKGFEIDIVYSEDFLLQQKWCVENNIDCTADWDEKVAIEQIKKFSPDIYFFAGNFKYYKSFFKKIRDHVGFIACWISASIPNNLNLENIDLMISDNEKILNYAKAMGCRAVKMLSSLPNPSTSINTYKNRSKELVFTGSLGRQFKKRNAILKYLIENNIGVEIYGMGLGEDSLITTPIEVVLRRMFPKVYQKLYDNKIIPLANSLKSNVNPPIFGEDMMDVLSRTKMILNMHSDYDLNYAVNMRVFEALGSGCLLFTEQNREVEKYFKNAEHLIYYSDKKDLLKKINFYKRNKNLAGQIGKNGQKEILNNHTVSKRIGEFISIVN
jgi:hypothetical protein